ncbi:MAG TPA: TolC family protein, partial [Burkholderiaceae bacterium]
MNYRFLPLLAALLGGCAITHVEPSKPAAAPAQFKEDGLWQRAQGATETVPAAWWTLFKDPVLDDLQQRLLIGNENLKSVATQVANARALLDAADQTGLPTLSVGGSGSRARSGGRVSDSSSLTASSSWEIDLWGGLAEATSRARAAYQASQNDLAAARLSAQALLTQSYFSLRAAELQGELLARSIKAYERSLELTKVRRAAGVVALTDVLQAE